jgi:hypothetical protein
MRTTLNACTSSLEIQTFQKECNVNDAIWRAKKEWANIPREILSALRYGLWAATCFQIIKMILQMILGALLTA